MVHSKPEKWPRSLATKNSDISQRPVLSVPTVVHRRSLAPFSLPLEWMIAMLTQHCANIQCPQGHVEVHGTAGSDLKAGLVMAASRRTRLLLSAIPNHHILAHIALHLICMLGPVQSLLRLFLVPHCPVQSMGLLHEEPHKLSNKAHCWESHQTLNHHLN